MIRNIKELFKITTTLVIGSLILWNCESDADQLGSQFFQNGATGVEKTYPIVAYNVFNNNSIRSDADRLQSATLGAFRESQFGLQKSAFVSQVRLSEYSPDFGTNPVLDSVVLVIKPQYAADSLTTDTDENYVYPVGLTPAKKVLSTYPVLKYGRTKIASKTLLNLKVEEVTEFLSSRADEVQSDRNVTTGAVLGTKTFDGNVRAVKITKSSDNSSLVDLPAAIRIPLDNTFFTNKILTKGSSTELLDAASFIRYFKGIKISVDDNDGYIFNFDPNGTEINLYYKKDKVEGAVTTREQSIYVMNAGSQNAQFNQFTFDRTNTPSESVTAASSQDSIVGASRLYAQGMGGPGIGLKVPDAKIAELKALYQTDKIGIISAKMRIYTDAGAWTSKYKKPMDFVVQHKVGGVTLDTYLQDLATLPLSGMYRLVKAYDLEKNPAYYDISITQTFKNIIESNKTIPAHFVVNVGAYTYDTNGNLVGAMSPGVGQNFNTRSFTPYRAVFVGTDLANPDNPTSAKLILTYGKK
ncbi:DUF4270 domain-containing protein [Chryseobacterium sp. SNU WT5]|uniref:DUF4270 family protein n=1 Tax=Chryseobacterium sp. SNU WT5 TaxID=2594269 RepID=UPI00117DBC86|nr:DUF4270 family protein [Chryseobacterium sp. SNU WT5]QDP86023.1 DUF4270 domain-containing protein [Chryseobacterium sp. SNU WT5]